eukprot:366331-Chlamydomonas_euryale.AAC.33
MNTSMLVAIQPNRSPAQLPLVPGLQSRQCLKQQPSARRPYALPLPRPAHPPRLAARMPAAAWQDGPAVHRDSFPAVP